MEEIETDILFLALTRPAMKFGVPFEALLINALMTINIGIILGSPLYWALGIVIHFPMRVIASKDHNFFRVYRLWFETKAQALKTSAWGGSMLSPLPHGNSIKIRDRASCV